MSINSEATSQESSGAIQVIGPCGSTYHFKCEYGGVLVQCPNCRKVYRIPTLEPTQRDSSLQRYLLNRGSLAAEVVTVEENPWQKVYEISQRLWSRDENYEICEVGQDTPIVVADRRRRFHNVGLIAGLTAIVFVLASLLRAGIWTSDLAYGLVLGLATVIIAMILLRFKFFQRHVVFSIDRRRSLPLFYIRDLNRIEFPTARFRVEDATGAVIGELRKTWLGDLLRSPWTVTDATGQVVLWAQEESLLLALLRRLFFTKLFWFRINFVFLDPATQEIVGEFNRQITLKDHYRLDLSANRAPLDMRLIWSLAVLLDSAERR